MFAGWLNGPTAFGDLDAAVFLIEQVEVDVASLRLSEALGDGSFGAVEQGSGFEFALDLADGPAGKRHEMAMVEAIGEKIAELGGADGDGALGIGEGATMAKAWCSGERKTVMPTH